MKHDYVYAYDYGATPSYRCRRCGAPKATPATACPGWPEPGTVYWRVTLTEVIRCVAQSRGRGQPFGWNPACCHPTEADASAAWRARRKATVLDELARGEGVERRWALGRIRSCEESLAAAHKALASLDERIAELRAEAQGLGGNDHD